MGRWLLYCVLLLVLVLGISVGFFNAQTVSFHYLAGTVELPLIALIVAELFVVAIVSLAVCAGRILTLRAEIHRLRRSLRDTESELKTLRELAVKDSN
jgi:lipopolysaccharide assembly protein A